MPLSNVGKKCFQMHKKVGMQWSIQCRKYGDGKSCDRGGRRDALAGYAADYSIYGQVWILETLQQL